MNRGMKTPALSVVIPAYNRIEPLKVTLRSARSAAEGLDVETLLVDDGSSPMLAEQLAGSELGSLSIIRQSNQGSIVARMAGLAAARGKHVLFLDSDDLVHPRKFSVQLAALEAGGCDVCYSDMAVAVPNAGSLAGSFAPSSRLPATSQPEELFLRIQPSPHNPIYRRDYLLRLLERPIVPVDRRFDPAGDVWLYYNLAPFPALIRKVDEPLTAVGEHDEDRFSRQWERIAVAALLTCREFAARCPRTPDTLAARIRAGECAFDGWRRLPRGMHRGFEDATLELWRGAPRGPVANLGTGRFAWLSRLLGPETAGRLLRRLRNGSYEDCRTLSPEEFDRLFSTAGLGPP